MTISRDAINIAIDNIGHSENTFKGLASSISRDILEYVAETGDIAAANRLVDSLSSANAEKFNRFIGHFLPYDYNKAEGRFTKKSKNPKVVQQKDAARVEFLADDGNDIWAWMSAMKKKAPAEDPKYEERIAKLVKKAMSDDEHGISLTAVIRALIKADVSLSEIVATIVAAAPKAPEADNAESNVVNMAA
jgi:hypothetical protein